MCSPMAGILALQGSGAIMSAMSSYAQAAQQKNVLNYQANIADINARLNELSADQEIKRGQSQQQELMLQTNQLKSSQKVAFAANGLDMTEGTPVQILQSTDFMAARDYDVIQANAARSAFGQRVQAMNFKNQATANRIASNQINPLMSGITSLISGASGVASSWYSMNRLDGLLPKDGGTTMEDPSRPFSRSGFGRGRGF